MLEDELRSDIPDIEDFVREQLYSGVNGREKPLRPTYTNDPYWMEVTKSPKAAKAKGRGYMKYKKKQTPPAASYLGLPPRNEDTPNLIIRGDFYESITAKIAGDTIRISTQGLSFGSDIEKKYGSIIFGLGGHAKSYLIKNKINPALRKYFKKFGL